MAALDTTNGLAADAGTGPASPEHQRPSVATALQPVGRRRLLPKMRAHGEKLQQRLRYPFSRRTPLLIQTTYNPKTLAAEKTIVDKRPLYWIAGLALLAIAPPVFGDNALLSAAAIFAIYAAINVVWMLIIGTAGIFSLATLAVVGAAAYGTAYLSIAFGLPWWGMIAVGPFIGLVFGIVIAIPAIRLEGFYYALLTVGLAELCRVYVVQSRIFGSATGGLFGADTYLPDDIPERTGLVVSYYAAFVLMLTALALYRIINGQRLGRLLRAAPEKHEAFAEALGINFRAARIRVFLISSAALGVIGGFYATHFKGASPSLFTMDSLLLLLAMIVIGGMGRPEGAVLGTLIVVLFDRVFITLGPVRLIIIGGVMLGTVLFMRGGLFGLATQYAAWREKRKSERRASRDSSGGETMPEQATDIRDKQTIYVRRFDKTVRDRLKTLITDELIAEHRKNVAGPHGDALERLLNYFRRAAIVDKYAILAVKPFAEYRIVALSGRRTVPPRLVDDQVYATPEEAQHAVFLRRIQDLKDS